MKTLRFGLAMSFALLIAAASASAAEPARATTAELPAALRALNANSSLALTTTEARAIRGQGGNAYGKHKSHHNNGLKRYSSIENYLGVQSITGDIYISGKNIRIGSHNHHFSIK